MFVAAWHWRTWGKNERNASWSWLGQKHGVMAVGGVQLCDVLGRCLVCRVEGMPWLSAVAVVLCAGVYSCVTLARLGAGHAENVWREGT